MYSFKLDEFKYPFIEFIFLNIIRINKKNNVKNNVKNNILRNFNLLFFFVYFDKKYFILLLI